MSRKRKNAAGYMQLQLPNYGIRAKFGIQAAVRTAMKGLTLFTLLFLCFQAGFAQCEKKVTFTCEKARSLKNGTVGQEMPINATISIENWKFTLTATMNGESETIEGDITEVVTCHWTEFLKNGRTQYKAVTRKGDQNPENSFIDIESDNGYTKITCRSDPDKGSGIQFDVLEYIFTEDTAAAIAPGKPPKPAKKAKRGKRQK